MRTLAAFATLCLALATACAEELLPVAPEVPETANAVPAPRPTGPAPAPTPRNPGGQLVASGNNYLEFLPWQAKQGFVFLFFPYHQNMDPFAADAAATGRLTLSSNSSDELTLSPWTYGNDGLHGYLYAYPKSLPSGKYTLDVTLEIQGQTLTGQFSYEK